MAGGILNNGVTIQWYGHSTMLITSPGGKRIMIDPFVQHNPACPPELHDVQNLDLLLITHGHFDHMQDVLEVIQSGKPKQVICIHEIGLWLGTKGVANVADMNRGGTQTAEGLQVTMTPALHSSGFMDGDRLVYGGECSGYVIEMEHGFRLYHSGDTSLFGDLALIGELWKPDLACLPIGGHYTMGPEEAARAARLLGVQRVLPIHYSTWPVLAGTPDRLREAGRPDGLEVLALQPGETLR